MVFLIWSSLFDHTFTLYHSSRLYFHNSGKWKCGSADLCLIDGVTKHHPNRLNLKLCAKWRFTLKYSFVWSVGQKTNLFDCCFLWWTGGSLWLWCTPSQLQMCSCCVVAGWSPQWLSEVLLVQQILVCPYCVDEPCLCISVLSKGDAAIKVLKEILRNICLLIFRTPVGQ